MTLGESIARLRAQKGWSQGDLAEALNVSRQSISKWETDGSIPELERLLQMSELFGITLDELVRGGDAVPAAAATAASIPASPQDWASSRRTAGICLLGSGCFLLLLGLILGGMVAAVLAFVAPPLIVCGIVCLTAKRRVLLKCAWAAYLTLDLTVRLFTAIDWQSAVRSILSYWRVADLYAPHLLLSAAQLLSELLLIVFTAHAFRSAAYAPTRRNKLCLSLGWAVYLLRWIAAFAPPLLALRQSWYTAMNESDLYLLPRFVGAILSWACAALFLVLLIRTRAFLQANKK